MTNRPPIPKEVQRQIFVEAGHRCAVCGADLPLERAHIIPWSRSLSHAANNLICLCANCHERADREKWGVEVLRSYKKNPWVLRSRMSGIPELPSPGEPHEEADSPDTSRPSFTSSQNPFSDLGRILDPTRFFDRVGVFEQVLGEVTEGRNVSLVGEVQVGKSSLLAQICAQARSRYSSMEFVYIDMQVLSSGEDFLDAVCEELGLPRNSRLEKALSGRHVVLCLDEFEKMGYQGFTPDIRDKLRGLANGNDAPLTLLLASRTSLDMLFPDCPTLSSPLAPICPEIRLPNFSPEVSRAFLRHRLANTKVRFSAEEEELLIRESQGHPGKLQQAARKVFAKYLEKGTG